MEEADWEAKRPDLVNPLKQKSLKKIRVTSKSYM